VRRLDLCQKLWRFWDGREGLVLNGGGIVIVCASTFGCTRFVAILRRLEGWRMHVAKRDARSGR